MNPRNNVRWKRKANKRMDAWRASAGVRMERWIREASETIEDLLPSNAGELLVDLANGRDWSAIQYGRDMHLFGVMARDENGNRVDPASIRVRDRSGEPGSRLG